MIKSLPWSYHPVEDALNHRVRHALAVVLRGASLVLSRLARRIATSRPASANIGHLEFYAEAGAPEGAIYADGLLVGYLSGVNRL